jgi:hypothetical protein
VHRDSVLNTTYEYVSSFYCFYGAIPDTHLENLVPLGAESCSCDRQAGNRNCLVIYSWGHFT